MLNAIKKTFTNFASYMLGLDEKLKNAKNDAERVYWQNQIIEAQRKQIEILDDENKKLKEQNQQKDLRIKELEENKKGVDLNRIKEMLLKTKQKIDRLDGRIEETRALFEVNPQRDLK